MSEEDHERRIASLEADRAMLYSKVNDLCTKVAVMITRWEDRPTLPCIEHKAEMARIERRVNSVSAAIDERLRKVESTGNRFVGAWDFAKIAFGAAIPVAIFFLGKLI